MELAVAQLVKCPMQKLMFVCPDIRRSVHVNPRCLQITADPPPCATLGATPNQLFSSALAVTPASPMAEAAPVLSPTRMNPRRRIEVGTIVNCKFSIIYCYL